MLCDVFQAFLLDETSSRCNKTWYTRVVSNLATLNRTRIDYNALFTPVITAVCVVQWKNVGLLILGLTLRITATANFFLLTVKFPEYFRTFIYILAKLPFCVLFIQSGKCMALHIQV